MVPDLKAALHLPMEVIIIYYYRIHIFMCVRNLCKFVQKGLLINLCDFLFMHSSALMYGAIKIYVGQIYMTCT